MFKDIRHLLVIDDKNDEFIGMISNLYRLNPYHNLAHAIMVLQFTYILLKECDLSKYFTEIETLAIYNLQGQLLYNNSYQNQNQISVDISSFSKGIYMIMINNRQPLKIIKD